MKFKSIIVLFFIFFRFFCFDSVFAVGIGAEPSFLDLKLKTGEYKKTKLFVYNVYSDPGIFQIFPDGMEDWIKIKPDNFRLEAGERKEIELIVFGKKAGQSRTNLSVLVDPLDHRTFGISSGIKIPLKLEVVDVKSIFLASLFGYVSKDWIWESGISTLFLLDFFLLKYVKVDNSKKY